MAETSTGEQDRPLIRPRAPRPVGKRRASPPNAPRAQPSSPTKVGSGARGAADVLPDRSAIAVAEKLFAMSTLEGLVDAAEMAYRRRFLLAEAGRPDLR
ncbi:hypothetical protein FSY75_14955 [Streptomyces sp. TR1341]|nr:hypothetical protein [Streptomyces sp. TR1341]